MATGMSGNAKRVRIYVDEGQLHGHQSLPVAIVGFLRKEGAAGATVFRGTEGFGASGEIHTARLADASPRLPVVIDWIDSQVQVERLLPQVKAMIRHGLITVDDTEIALFCPPVRAIAGALCAGDVMSRDVVSVAGDAAIRHVVELLVGKGYRALPVVHEGLPIGIITNSDLLHRGGLGIRVDLLASLRTAELDAELERLAASSQTARSVMTPSPVTVHRAAPLTRVAETMAHGHLKRLPVVDDHGAMVGMISRVDVLRTATTTLPRVHDEEPYDIGFSVNAPISGSMRRDVPTVFQDTPLPEVLQAVISTRLNRCIVVDRDRRVLGKITDAELLERVTPSLRPSALHSLIHRLPFAGANPDEQRAQKRATARIAADLLIDTAIVGEREPLAEAIASMLSGPHKIVAVVDTEGRLVGCLDRADILRGLLSTRNSR